MANYLCPRQAVSSLCKFLCGMTKITSTFYLILLPCPLVQDSMGEQIDQRHREGSKSYCRWYGLRDSGICTVQSRKKKSQTQSPRTAVRGGNQYCHVLHSAHQWAILMRRLARPSHSQKLASPKTATERILPCWRGISLWYWTSDNKTRYATSSTIHVW